MLQTAQFVSGYDWKQKLLYVTFVTFIVAGFFTKEDRWRYEREIYVQVYPDWHDRCRKTSIF